MIINKRAKAAVGALAVAVAIGLAAGGAFTAGGVTDTSGDGFVGGNVDQTITGAVVTNVAYGLDATADNIETVDITTDAGGQGRTVSIAFTGGTTNTAVFTCVESGVAGVYNCTHAAGARTVDATGVNIKVV